MRPPLHTEAAPHWSLDHRVGFVEPALLQALREDFDQPDLHRALDLSVKANPMGESLFSLSIPPHAVLSCRPVGAGEIQTGAEITAEFHPRHRSTLGDPHVNARGQPASPVLGATPALRLIYRIDWSGAEDPREAARVVHDDLRAAAASDVLVRMMGETLLLHAGEAAREALAERLDLPLDAVPEDRSSEPMLRTDHADYLFDLWWFGLSPVGLSGDEAEEPLLWLDERYTVTLAAQLQAGQAGLDASPEAWVWIDPESVLEHVLAQPELQMARDTGLVRELPAGEPRPLVMVGVLPESAEDLDPYLVIGNETYHWRLYLPDPDLWYADFSFTTWDDLYLAHNGANLRFGTEGGNCTSRTLAPWAPPFPLEAGLAREHALLLNRDFRPDHTPWKARVSKIATPLVLQVEVSAGGRARQVRIVNDEIDRIRQEYGFHMNWTEREPGGDVYYQTGQTHSLDRARGVRTLLAGDHRQTEIAGESRPALRAYSGGTVRPIPIPPRAWLRYVTPAERLGYTGRINGVSDYNFTLFPPGILDWVLGIADEYDALRTLVLGQADEIGDGGPYPEELDDIPDHILDQFKAAIDDDPDAREADVVLTDGLMAARDVQVNSNWRPPEHNEWVRDSVVNSFHQIGRAIDIGHGTGPGNRSPLSMSLLYLVLLERQDAGELDRVLVELAARGGRIYIIGAIPEDRRDWLVGERMEDGDRVFTIRQPPPPGAEEDDEGEEGGGGEEVEGGDEGEAGEAPAEEEEEAPAIPAIDVPNGFGLRRHAFEDARPAGGYDESMTVREVMEHAMGEASHAHIVFPPPE